MLILFMILLVPNVLSDGTCESDKSNYHPGETATFTCMCTLGNEENRAGIRH